jgi:hypothetical protein
LNTSTNVITFPATGYYTFTFSTYTGVTGNAGNVTLDQTNSTMVPFNASYESIAAGNVALSLAVTSSYITIGGLANVTLPTGVNGQIKTIIASGNIANVGNSIVTASGAGWLGAGNITLTAQGSGCTLQSDGTKWWCIGNNGAVFS